MSAHAPQYTIRGIPLEVDRALRERAKQRKKSINQVIIDELTLATLGHRKYADFSDLVGCMEPDPELEEILQSQRQIEPEVWR